jgi:acyl-CoA dehydrogenase
MTDLTAFRQEASRWLAATCPRSLVGVKTTPFDGCWGGRRAVYENPDTRRWLDAMAERGWTAPTWPVVYGGGGLGEEEAAVLREEMAAQRLPAPLIGFGLTMIGPMLLEYGNAELRREHLPPIVRGEIRWAQGYSEPGAGSDLASLTTRAVRAPDDPDVFVVTGQKCWMSYGDLSDWAFCLVRTDPAAKQQAGITFLLLDLVSTGVTVRPTLLISGKSPFCEVFLEGVRVPARNVVGRVDGGWTIAKALLQHERTQHGDVFSSGADGEDLDLSRLARDRTGDDSGRIADAVLRDRIAGNDMDHAAFRYTLERISAGRRAGRKPGAESSLLKVEASELNMRRLELALHVLGPDALGWAGPGFDDTARQTTRDWLRSRGNSIEGGTTEIQLEILAKQVLGLP